MGLNNPVPRSLSSESKKAAKILASFVKPNQILGQDMVIPAHVLQNAKGLVVLTVLKAGFLFSGRAGSGVILARLPDNSWSAPSAIVTAGAGVGGQIGAEITDFVFILNTRSAVESFSKAGSITLGGNVSLAAGPLGRNAEAAGTTNFSNAAAIFSYSKTKGLFAGVSLEGSVLVERREANRKFYGQDCTSKSILAGRVEPPPACDPLFRVLESRAFNNRTYDDDADDFYDDIPDEFSDSGESGHYSNRKRGGSNASRRRYDDDDIYDDYDDYGRSRSGSVRERDRDNGYRRGGNDRSSAWQDDYYDRPSGGSRRGGNSRRNYDDDNEARSHFRSNYSDSPGRPNAPKPRFGSPMSTGRNGGRDGGRDFEEEHRRDRERETMRRNEGRNRGEKAVALYKFEGDQSGDLSFQKGDIITILKKSDSQDDWWTGSIGGQQGIFPANYVELI